MQKIIFSDIARIKTYHVCGYVKKIIRDSVKKYLILKTIQDELIIDLDIFSKRFNIQQVNVYDIFEIKYKF